MLTLACLCLPACLRAPHRQAPRQAGVARRQALSSGRRGNARYILSSKRLAILLFTLFLLALVTPVPQVAAQSCVQPPAGLVSWWPGDGDANDIIGGNDGILEGGMRQRDVVDYVELFRLLVPTAKDLDGPTPPAPDPNTHNVDHYKCYKVGVTPGTGKFKPILGVKVDDQFTDGDKLFDLKKPTRLCNPVDKNGGGIKNDKAHLMCYEAKPASGEPKHEKVLGIHVNNLSACAHRQASSGKSNWTRRRKTSSACRRKRFCHKADT